MPKWLCYSRLGVAAMCFGHSDSAPNAVSHKDIAAPPGNTGRPRVPNLILRRQKFVLVYSRRMIARQELSSSVVKATNVRPGEEVVAKLTEGTSTMQAGLASYIPEIVAECGGGLACPTCHVFVDQDDVDRLTAPSADEEEMLDSTASPGQTDARLSCQITAGPDLDDLVVRVPPTQYCRHSTDVHSRLRHRRSGAGGVSYGRLLARVGVARWRRARRRRTVPALSATNAAQRPPRALSKTALSKPGRADTLARSFTPRSTTTVPRGGHVMRVLARSLCQPCNGEMADRPEMAAPRSDCLLHPHLGRSADRAGGQAFGRRHLRRVKASFSSTTITAVLAISLAPTSVADATANLTSQLDAARGGCSRLQSDPVLNDVALRANSETQSYIEHTARFEPFEDPMPVLRGMGYKAGKAKLIPGYGDTEAKAIYGVILHGWVAIPDCTYTRYGVNVLNNPEGMHGGYVLAALVLAGD
jgi:ferredoxin